MIKLKREEIMTQEYKAGLIQRGFPFSSRDLTTVILLEPLNQLQQNP
jgi:hypothetical protein